MTASASISEEWLVTVGFRPVPSDTQVVMERPADPYWTIRLWLRRDGAWDVTLDGRPARAVSQRHELVQLVHLLGTPLRSHPNA